MKEGPNIAIIGSLIGDPARANILTALMNGKALTARELALEAGITAQTASSHLKKLEQSELLRQRKQGRHKYYTLADDDVADLLESLMGMAAKRGLLRTRPGPKNDDLRKARVCYNHLAGELGVHLYNSLLASHYLQEKSDEVVLTNAGHKFVFEFGIDPGTFPTSRRPLCKSCLDWSARRSHLAGTLGSAFLQQFYHLGWASRQNNSRIVKFTKRGEGEFFRLFGPAQS